MADEQLYTVEGATATPAQRVSLTKAGLLERQHLQEWVIAHPEILGEDVLIITFEFDRWITGVGSPTWERLDVLALDRAGRLVVAELKRDVAPDAVMVQALNYAAMARGFSLDLLVEAYGARRNGELTAAELQDELREWAPSVSDETLRPRGLFWWRRTSAQSYGTPRCSSSSRVSTYGWCGRSCTRWRTERSP